MNSHTRTCVYTQCTEQWGPTCRLTNSWKAWSMAERLWSSRDLNFIFSTSLNVSKTTAKSYKKGDRNDNKTLLQSEFESMLNAVPDSWWNIALWRGKRWRTHRTSGSWSMLASSHQGNYKKKELTWDKKTTHDALKAELQPAECKPINIKDVTSHTVQFFLLKSIFGKINPIFKEFWNEPTGTESWGLHQVLLNLLSCGQEHEQTDEAVFQCAEVLQSERHTYTHTH